MDPQRSWNVDVALDHMTIAKFECKICGNYKCCTLKKVNGEYFDGNVRFFLYEYDEKARASVKIAIRSLYVSDHTNRVSGSLILNLVKKMVHSLEPHIVATLEDASNVKVLALLTTGRSYYEHMGFQYVHRDGTRIQQERNDFQRRNINATLLLSCLSQKLELWSTLTLAKQVILGAFITEVGQGSRELGDFWKVYRNVMKSSKNYLFG
jgi:hypothetical protein